MTGDPSFVRGARLENGGKRLRGPRDLIALAIASCGVGFIPLAPGTWGSMLGVALYLIAQKTQVAHSSRVLHPLPLFLVIFLTLVGVWAAARAESLFGHRDPRPVVIDEVVGQFVVFLFARQAVDWRMVLIGFALFRLFDTWKPYPIRRVERLASGVGIMADDLIAGLYAGATLWTLLFWRVI